MSTYTYSPSVVKQTMRLADDLFPRVRARLKYFTVRAGRRDVLRGLMAFESAHGTAGTCLVIVQHVLVMSLKSLPENVLVGDGVQNAEELLEVLRKYYPDITLDSEVTAIGFSYLGELADEAVAEAAA